MWLATLRIRRNYSHNDLSGEISTKYVFFPTGISESGKVNAKLGLPIWKNPFFHAMKWPEFRWKQVKQRMKIKTMNLSERLH